MRYPGVCDNLAFLNLHLLKRESNIHESMSGLIVLCQWKAEAHMRTPTWLYC